MKDQMTLVQQPTMPLNSCEVKEGGGEVKVSKSVLIQSKKKTFFFQVNKMPWFHGKISREVAEKLLTPRTDGLFLASDQYQSLEKDRTMIKKDGKYLALGERVHQLPR